jgi:hypothetical protein
MKSKEIRKAEAVERQAEYDKLTITQKILGLDLRLGGGKGAVKQRAKLALQLQKESEGRVPKVDKPEEKKKPYQKPKKS